MTSRPLRLVSLCAALLALAADLPARAAAERPAASRFVVEDLDGESLVLDELLERGPVLLDFWATWCKPCAALLPEIESLQLRYRDRGLTVIGVSIDGPRNFARVRPFAARAGLTYPLVLDRDGRLQADFHVTAVPTTILIDSTGAIARVYQGYRPGEEQTLDRDIEALLAPAQPATGIAISNLLEVQNGNIPFEEPSNRLGFYEQLNLDVTRSGIRLGLRFEADHNSQDRYTYDEITQRFAEWNDPRFRVRAGNFYTILGRGLVHRSFDLPGVVLDQPGARSRYGPSRDVDGVLLEGQAGPFRGLGFSGRPNGGTISPGFEAEGGVRYAGQVSGLDLSARPWRATRVGACYSRFTPDGSVQHELGSGYVEADPFRAAGVEAISLPLYVEYARQAGTFGEWWNLETGDEIPHALYAGANLIRGPVTFSAEWKDYSQFRLGTNDPPSVVREHGWTLLNRGTHVLDATLEEGFGLEAGWNVNGWLDLTVNRSRSDGRFTLRRPWRFEETYVEAHVMSPANAWETTLFYDTGKDEFSFIESRRVVGGGARVSISALHSITADVQAQSADRVAESFDDLYMSVGLARADLGSAALTWERTTDPAEETPADSETPGIVPRHFLGATVSARLSDRHEVILFGGTRRGGRACTAGTCYEVLSFKGTELRLSSRF